MGVLGFSFFITLPVLLHHEKSHIDFLHPGQEGEKQEKENTTQKKIKNEKGIKVNEYQFDNLRKNNISI